MRLFRGMYYNWMSHPQQQCELLEAGPAQVRARCNRPYLAFFGQSGRSYGVTVEELLAANGWSKADRVLYEGDKIQVPAKNTTAA